MANLGTIDMMIHFANREALQAMVKGRERVAEALGDYPWCDTLKEAQGLLGEAFEGLTVSPERMLCRRAVEGVAIGAASGLDPQFVAGHDACRRTILERLEESDLRKTGK